MNAQTSLRTGASLIERAAEHYDFRAALAPPPLPEPKAQRAPAPGPEKPQPIVAEPEPVAKAEPFQEAHTIAAPAAQDDDWPEAAAIEQEPLELAAPFERSPARLSKVDRASLREGGFILPDAPVGSLAEEFRIVKRQLLQAASGKTGIPEDKRQTILVCSAGENEGKTFCAVNLAISMANEKDLEVLLVDGDFSKPEILSVLGLEGGPGLIDAIADPDLDPESLIIQTDVERLSVLPAGQQANNVSELLASKRTRQVMDALTADHPKRIVIFDSPPALMASPASILAGKVGQVMMVVRADQTTESELREAVGLLSGCENISLMLNAAGYAATGRRFGSYYGFSQ
jgi:exopolysaccharide/PEP-CTERM locus tyrosine autokinase